MKVQNKPFAILAQGADDTAAAVFYGDSEGGVRHVFAAHNRDGRFTCATLYALGARPERFETYDPATDRWELCPPFDLRPTFQTPYQQYAKRNGQPFIFRGEVPWQEYDRLETGPLYYIQFLNGTIITAWPEEIEAGALDPVARAEKGR